MLRRRPDNTFEYRDIERVLYASAPNTLSPERKEALRLRIFSQLGAQDEARPGLAGTARERWIAIPVGVGIAATVIVGGFMESLIGPLSPLNADFDRSGSEGPEAIHALAGQIADVCCAAVAAYPNKIASLDTHQRRHA